MKEKSGLKIPEPMKLYRTTYYVLADGGRILERQLHVNAPNSQGALSKTLRLLLAMEEHGWKISRFEEVEPGSAPG